MRYLPILLLAAGCGDPEADYGNARVEPTSQDGSYWPTTGRVRQGFYGTDSYSEPGWWVDEAGAMRRFDGPGNFHRGVDIENARGTPVYAAHLGTASVYPYGESQPSGNTVIVADPTRGVWSIYCHLAEVTVPNGGAVTPSTMIGRIGSSGGQGYPHLHFNYIVPHDGGWADRWTPGVGGEMLTSGAPIGPSVDPVITIVK